MDQKRGRPPKAEDERADDRLEIRLLATEKEEWQEAADKEGIKLAAWIKNQLNAATKKRKRQSE